MSLLLGQGFEVRRLPNSPKQLSFQPRQELPLPSPQQMPSQRTPALVQWTWQPVSGQNEIGDAAQSAVITTDVIGQGVQGNLFAGILRHTGEQVAVKKLKHYDQAFTHDINGNVLSDQDRANARTALKQAFANEIRILETLSHLGVHPNIVKCLGKGGSETPEFTMEKAVCVLCASASASAIAVC